MIEPRISIAVWHHVHSEQGWKFDVDGLGSMGFTRRVDPWTAFQELSMWVGGVLPRPGRPMVEMSGERVMVAKHGFDERSFRRQSAKVANG